MISVTDDNREDILKAYSRCILDSMDWDSLYNFTFNIIKDNKNLMDNYALEYEILSNYPDILKD